MLSRISRNDPVFSGGGDARLEAAGIGHRAQIETSGEKHDARDGNEQNGEDEEGYFHLFWKYEDCESRLQAGFGAQSSVKPGTPDSGADRLIDADKARGISMRFDPARAAED